MRRAPSDSFVNPWREQHFRRQTQLHALVGRHTGPVPLDTHVHREVEVGLVLSGEQQIHFADTVQVCRPGDVWLCASFEPHGWMIERSGARTVVLVFQPEFVGEEMLGDVPWLTLLAVPPTQRPRVRSPQVRSQVLMMGEMLRQEVAEKAPGWESLVRVDLLHLLLLLRREWRLEDPSAVAGARLGTLARVMPALTLTHSFPRQRLTVPEAARACGLSPSHFQSLFRRATGLSYGQFSLRARLALAANRMLNTDRSVSAIAAEAGFTDGSHLHRRFRQYYHRTPRQFRGGRGDE